MLVRTGATVDLLYLIRSMNTFNPFAKITSTIIVIKRYLRVTSYFAEFLDGQVLVGEKEFPVQTNNDGIATAQHLRDGLIREEGPIDAPAADIPWKEPP
jgi:hypothetical protein